MEENLIKTYDNLSIGKLMSDLPDQLRYEGAFAPMGVEFLTLFFLLFSIGLTGIIFNYRNYLVTMLCIEMMYLGITVCFLILGVSLGDARGQIYGLLLIIIAAAESAIGLGILVVLYKFGKSIDFSDYEELRG